METVLIIGCGDIGLRTLPLLQPRYRIAALARDEASATRLSAVGVNVIRGDLDSAASLMPLAGRADVVIHLAPPPERGSSDPRTRALLDAIDCGRIPNLPTSFVYISTSGVYGDCHGEWVDETRAIAPQSDRARRRADAEQAVLEWGRARDLRVVILRVPGIYAADRLPIERLRHGTPALRAEDDVFTNHIHADDLAAIVVAATERARPGGIYNAADDSAMRMGEYFDLVADRAGLARPERISRHEAAGRLSPMMLSFMSESRRLVNRRMKSELGIRLRYPTVHEGIPSHIDLALPTRRR